ncbi:MAG: GTPase HflX [Phycisphaerae bacterium]|nr:GTPase HflX [Phycisphaerae bacterium]
MKEVKRISNGVAAEKAVLVGLILPDQDRGVTRYDPLSELAALASAAGAEIVGRMVQRRPTVCPATCIGSGKAAELALYAADKSADIIIFDNDLAPSQIREIEKIAKRRVIDRTELILDIFASRARTHAARLQVELAQLEYTAPRLRGMWTHLERIAGAGGGQGAGAVGGIGTRGPGERQIEIDRRLVQKRVTFLREQLQQIDNRKLREVRSRSDHFTVSLVGYTNAGKSTLMNALTGANTLVEDKLFATLDTKTRRWDLGGGQSSLLSDTVGFVRNLPHHLVASFRATLEEAIHSDLLLHVIDASSHDAAGQVRAVEHVLVELGCSDIPRINVLNKVDALQDDSSIHLLRNELDDAIEISAQTGQGIPRLSERVIELMRHRYARVQIETSSSNGRLLAYVSQYGHILHTSYSDEMMLLDVRLPTQEIPRVVNLGGRVVS